MLGFAYFLVAFCSVLVSLATLTKLKELAQKRLETQRAIASYDIQLAILYHFPGAQIQNPENDLRRSLSRRGIVIKILTPPPHRPSVRTSFNVSLTFPDRPCPKAGGTVVCFISSRRHTARQKVVCPRWTDVCPIPQCIP